MRWPSSTGIKSTSRKALFLTAQSPILSNTLSEGLASWRAHSTLDCALRITFLHALFVLFSHARLRTASSVVRKHLARLGRWRHARPQIRKQTEGGQGPARSGRGRLGCFEPTFVAGRRRMLPFPLLTAQLTTESSVPIQYVVRSFCPIETALRLDVRILICTTYLR